MGKPRGNLAIVLMSGGMDSCVTAALAHRAGHELAALHICYGQRTEARELRAFHAVADFYGIAHRQVVEISYLRQIGGSALTDPNQSVQIGLPQRLQRNMVSRLG